MPNDQSARADIIRPTDIIFVLQVNETGKELEKLTQELLNQASASMNELQDKIHNASQHSGH